MKKYSIVITLLFCSISFGQDNHRSADKNFESLWYLKAAKQYEAIIKKGDTSRAVLQKVGDAYYFSTDMKNAGRWYGELFSKYEHVVDAKYTFRYIHALEGVGDYDQAKALMKIHGEKLDAKGFKVDQLNTNDAELDELLNRQPQFYLTNLSINTKVADFGTAYFKDKIVFASSRDSLKLRTRLYRWNDQPYLNLFVADTMLRGTDLKNIHPFSTTINTKYHEAVTAFNKAGNEVYFTRNNYTDKNLKRDDEGMNHLKMYHADLVDNEWVAVKEVPFNSDDYSVGQPALSVDEKKLYFVSDMPGSIGATDIFVVDIAEDGSFSEPKNLGPTINTGGREMFPFLTEGKLYFSSDGHLGLGGLDVFESHHTDVFSKPANLGKPLNSKKDDFGYIVNEETQRGYVSSNREGGKGDDDIYSFERIKTVCEQRVVGSVVQMGIKERNKLIVEKDGILKIMIGLVSFDLGKANIRYDAEIELDRIVVLLGEYPEMVIKIESHTDSRSDDANNLELSDRRAKATRDYIIAQGISEDRIESAIGYGESKLLNNCKNGVACSNQEHDVNRRSEFIITKM